MYWWTCVCNSMLLLNDPKNCFLIWTTNKKYVLTFWSKITIGKWEKSDEVLFYYCSCDLFYVQIHKKQVQKVWFVSINISMFNWRSIFYKFPKSNFIIYDLFSGTKHWNYYLINEDLVSLLLLWKLPKLWIKQSLILN